MPNRGSSPAPAGAKSRRRSSGVDRANRMSLRKKIHIPQYVAPPKEMENVTVQDDHTDDEATERLSNLSLDADLAPQGLPDASKAPAALLDPSPRAAVAVDNEVARAIKQMSAGSPLLKYGRRGDPHFRRFRLTSDRSRLEWLTQKRGGEKLVRSVDVITFQRIECGQKSAVFRRNPKSTLNNLSFSIYYTGEGDQEQTLDLVCKDTHEFDTWYHGLQFLCDNKTKIGDLDFGDALSPGLNRGSSIRLDDDVVTAQDLQKTIKDSTDCYMWGQGAWGQLGLSFNDQKSATLLRGIGEKSEASINSISCGRWHTMCISDIYEVWAWGHAGSGRCGITRDEMEEESKKGEEMITSSRVITEHLLKPYRINFFDPSQSGKRITSVACGDSHTLFVSENGILWACGTNAFGELGIGSYLDSARPQKVHIEAARKGHAKSAQVVVRSAAAGQYLSACIGDIDGAESAVVFTWGCGMYGALGHGDENDLDLPKPVERMKGTWHAHQIACGDHHMLCVADCREETIPDYRAQDGDLDDDENEGSPSAANGTVLRHASTVRRRPSETKGLVLSWGCNDCGQLGLGDLEDCYEPQVVVLLRLKHAQKVACGANHSACVAEVPAKLLRSMSGVAGDIRTERSDNGGGQLYIWGACSGVKKKVQMTGNKRIDRLNNPKASKLEVYSAPKAVSSITSYEDGDMKQIHGVTELSCGELFTAANFQDHVNDEGESIMGLYLEGITPEGFEDGIQTSIDDKTVRGFSAGGYHLGLRTERQWLNDSDVPCCGGCSKEFSVFVRKHHCRNCGNIFCKDCASTRTPIMRLGYSTPVRVCDRCAYQIGQSQGR